MQYNLFFHMSDQVLALLFFQLRRGWLLPAPRRIGASVAGPAAMVAGGGGGGTCNPEVPEVSEK